MKLFIQKWLGIIDSNSAFAELEGVLERIRDLEFKCDDIKYETENIECTVNELEIRIDEIDSNLDSQLEDIKYEKDSLKDEVNEVLTNFESMTEGYTVSVKLNPPLS